MMICRTLSPRHRPLAQPWVKRLPGAQAEPFWRRVRSGFYHLVGLSRKGERELEGILVASVDEREGGRELWLQLSVRPNFARDHRPELQDLVLSLAERFGCTRIVFDSKRRGWERVASSLGFATETVVRCTLEVPYVR